MSGTNWKEQNIPPAFEIVALKLSTIPTTLEVGLTPSHCLVSLTKKYSVMQSVLHVFVPESLLHLTLSSSVSPCLAPFITLSTSDAKSATQICSSFLSFHDASPYHSQRFVCHHVHHVFSLHKICFFLLFIFWQDTVIVR
jgi:hypothetical protein